MSLHTLKIPEFGFFWGLKEPFNDRLIYLTVQEIFFTKSFTSKLTYFILF